MSFVPKITLRERSKGDPDRSPRWFKQALGTIEERGANRRLWFVPNRVHPALRELPDVHLGIEGEPGTVIAMERAYRDTNLTKRAWRRNRSALRETRIVERGLKLAA